MKEYEKLQKPGRNRIQRRIYRVGAEKFGQEEYEKIFRISGGEKNPERRRWYWERILDQGRQRGRIKSDRVQPVAGADQTRWRSPGSTALTLDTMEFFLTFVVLSVLLILVLGYTGYSQKKESEGAQLLKDLFFATTKDLERVEKSISRYYGGKWLMVLISLVALLLNSYIQGRMDSDINWFTILAPLFAAYTCHVLEKRYRAIREEILIGKRDEQPYDI